MVGSKMDSPLAQLAIRFFVGGAVVSAFSLLADLFKPKSFSGLFGAAPSVALASLILVVRTQDAETATIEARSMLIAAFALLLYASLLSHGLLQLKFSALKGSVSALLVWLAAAVGLWYAALGG